MMHLSPRTLPSAAALLLGSCSLSTAGSAAIAATSDANGISNQDASSASDAGVDAAVDANETDASQPEAALPWADCSFGGRYALKVTTKVRWDAKVLGNIVPIIEEGNGEMEMLVMLDAERTDLTTVTGTLRVCDVTVPQFDSTILVGGGESYAVRFPTDAFEAYPIAETPVRVELQCPEVGCGSYVPPISVMMGVEMANPFAAWPESRKALSYPDEDNDGYGAITLEALGPADGDRYRPPPVDTNPILPARAAKLMLGIRANLELQGQFDSCTSTLGESTDFTIDTHLATCTLEGSGTTCNDEQASFLDSNLPQWLVEEASFEGHVIDPLASCADVRAAF